MRIQGAVAFTVVGFIASLLYPQVTEITGRTAFADEFTTSEFVDEAASWKDSASQWRAGFDFIFVRPQFEDNTAFTVLESDGASFESFSDRTLDYDFKVAPRAWFGYQWSEDIGMKATYWGFDQSSGAVSANPPANGFGRIDHPFFNGVDITSTVPTDTFATASGLKVYTIDLEVTNSRDVGAWTLASSGGLRYASMSQNYSASLTDDTDTLLGQINFRHRLNGIGPTLAIQAQRPIYGGLAVFGTARGSLLFGDGDATLNAGEDLDTGTPLTTTRQTTRNDVLPITELQLGLNWTSDRTALGIVRLRGALEGQLWSGAGSATSESGDLGFLGFAVGMEFLR